MDEQGGLVTELPWPPSVNHYWRRCGARYFVSQEGNRFRDKVINICSQLSIKFDSETRLEIFIEAYPPDRRRRDLDNILKSLLDSLQHAGVYDDDSQIDGIHVVRMPSREGKVVVKIQSILNLAVNSSS